MVGGAEGMKKRRQAVIMRTTLPDPVTISSLSIKLFLKHFFRPNQQNQQQLQINAFLYSLTLIT